MAREANLPKVGVNIMRRMTATALMLLAPLLFAVDGWGTTLPGGNMRFQGQIIAESCRVEIGDRSLIVDMGRISSNRLLAVGEDTNPIPFQIHLQDCTTAVSQHVRLAFYGVADTHNPDVLAIGEQPGAATGVGIALFDERDNLIPLNQPLQPWHRLYRGPVTLYFIAKYRATRHNITGGPANAQAWFALTYQ